jgi:hypothetical protein
MKRQRWSLSVLATVASWACGEPAAGPEAALSPTFAVGGVGRPAVLVNPRSDDNGTARTIQEGIDMAAEGGVVLVLPGTYDEQLVIAKGLTLEGTGGASGDVVIEKTVAAPTTASDAVISVTTQAPVTIRTLTIRHVGLRGLNAMTAADVTIAQAAFEGVWPASFPATPVFNNSISVVNNAGQSGGRARLVVRDSRISTDGTGISPGGDVDVLIAHNVVRSSGGCIQVSTTGQGVTVPAGVETNADILDNEFPECGQNRTGRAANGINVLGSVGATTVGTVNIIGNTFRNTVRAPGFCNTAAVAYNYYSGRVEHNTFIDVVQPCATDAPVARPAAVWVGSRTAALPVNPSVRFNDFIGNAFAGLRIGPFTTNAIDASCNYWGSADGPSGVGPGSGDAVLVEAGGAMPMFTPFATSPIAESGTTIC